MNYHRSWNLHKSHWLLHYWFVQLKNLVFYAAYHSVHSVDSKIASYSLNDHSNSWLLEAKYQDWSDAICIDDF